MCDDDLKSVLEDDWEDEGLFTTSREQIDVDLELWDDDESMNSEESSNVGNGRRRSVLKILTNMAISYYKSAVY
eukprot:14027055-Ditylum_brightwellii.AAC.1